MDTHLGEHPQWKNTDIPYSTLAPELVYGEPTSFPFYPFKSNNLFLDKEVQEIVRRDENWK